ncbi:hypothetical protein [Streptomyces sp. NPDC050560]|uniref:hypothetical protein n=1 Tax=Streptomyces sp. NPDC050560 TaxID=3365630 RepID=UPI00378FD99F
MTPRRQLARGAVAAAGCALLLVLATGCGDDYDETRGKGDAPVKGRHGDDTAVEVYNFPDGFGNLATKCVGPGKRGYTRTKAYSQDSDDDDPKFVPAHEAVVDDPACH